MIGYAVQSLAPTRATAETKVAALLEWPEPERALAYVMLHNQGMRRDTAVMVLRKAGWWLG